MKIPIKIQPDRIKDSIVQVFFTSDLPFELLIGYFHRVLIKEQFHYISQPNIINQGLIEKQQQANQEININLSHLFVNDKKTVKLQIHPNKSLSFNNISAYIGWAAYSEYIDRVLNTLINADLIKSVNRVGVRYISEFQNINILDKIKFNYDTSFPGSPITTSQSNLRWIDGDKRISMNIASGIPVHGIVNDKGLEVEFISLIDVDVIKSDFDSIKLDSIIEIISATHNKQKEVFFSLLKEDFLNELNPVY